MQDGLAGNKNKNSDEFLIEKKNPLRNSTRFWCYFQNQIKKSRGLDKAEKIDKDIEKLFQKNDIQ